MMPEHDLETDQVQAKLMQLEQTIQVQTLRPEETDATNKTFYKQQIAALVNYVHRVHGVRYNLLTEKIEWYDPAQQTHLQLTNRDLNEIHLCLQEDGFVFGNYTVSMDNLMKVLNSKRIPSFDPITQLAADLPKWNGKDHIKTMVDAFVLTNKEQRPDVLQLFKRWCICMLHCARNPKVTNEVMPVIVSPHQGIGKSRFWKWFQHPVLEPYCYNGHINFEDKDAMLNLSSCILINIDDQLDIILGREAGILKGIFSMGNTDMRRSYDRLSERRTRRASFCGSINTVDYLTDSENRRYFTISVTKIIHDILPDLNQLWAQIFHLADLDKRHWFDDSDKKMQEAINQHHTQSTMEYDLLGKFYEPAEPGTYPNKFMLPTEIKAALMEEFSRNYPSAQKINLQDKRMKNAYTRLGFQYASYRDPFHGPRHGYWVKEKAKTI